MKDQINTIREALEDLDDQYNNRKWDALTALDQIEKMMGSQEPVAWVQQTDVELTPADAFSWVQTAAHNLPLYTAAPVAQQPQAEAVRWGIDWGTHGDRTCVSIIKKHEDGTMEIVATEYEPERKPAPKQAEAVPPHAEIYVGNGRFAICDWADFETVKSYNWNLTNRGGNDCFYAQAWTTHSEKTRNQVRMHNLIACPPQGMLVDHINGDGLDNRRRNLRVVTKQQNSFNQKPKGGSSKYKGVSLEKETGLWRAYIRANGKRISLGRHAIEEDAARAYDIAAKEYFGEHAKTNFD